MKTAIISDIHGNYDGLLTVLQDIAFCNCQRIICLGDLVEGGDKNEEVVFELINRRIASVRGNHDEYNNLFLNKATQNYLLNLPEEIIEDNILYTHISPRKRRRKIDTDVEAWNVFEEWNYKIIFVGHIHYPLIYGKNNDEPFYAKQHEFIYNQSYDLNTADNYIISVGAIGYARDNVQKLRYAIFDSSNYSIEIRAINGFLLF